MEKIVAKRSLGQNFLKCGWVLGAIVKAAELGGEDIVLEVGPGKGILTKKLLEHAGRVVAVEKDDRLIPYLGELFAAEIASGKLVLVHGDILDDALRAKLPLGEAYSIVANIPYYITGQFFRLFLESARQPKQMIVMVQKEVADRIVARDGKESILSMAVKAYGTPHIIEKVPRGCFSPEPNVDSALLQVTGISKKFFSGFDEETFFTMLKAGFAQKRKRVLGNLKKFIRDDVELPIPKNARAEELSLEDWKKLISHLYRYKTERSQNHQEPKERRR